ncbi:MAG: B12-binding domain-containing radical SAM protein [Sedimentisphaerales bacterium]
MSNKPSILLVNPPIYDFTAFDFWLKPLGMLTIAGKIANKADFKIFDFLDHEHSFYADKPKFKSDVSGRGDFFSSIIPKPDLYKNIPRHYRRYGLPAEIFADFLKTTHPCDFVFIQTVMTYWYLGYREVIETVKTYQPQAKIVLGGPYAMICPEHAKNLGADFVSAKNNSDRLWDFLDIKPADSFLPLWNVYKNPQTAVMKITRGCPFKCTYCTVPIFDGEFTAKPAERIIEELKFLISLGVKNIAFYDDALLYKSDEVLKPFLRYVIDNKIAVSFHTPNALNARFLDAELAELMIKAGFKTFFLGFESSADEFQKQTGSKIFDNEFANAVKNLIAAGADRNSVAAYLILGHPKFEIQNIEQSMKFVNSLNIRVMLSDFSPIPGTPDGKLCEKYIDISEPLMHNKTAFPIIVFGGDAVNRIKDMCRDLNRKVSNDTKPCSIPAD